MLCQKGDKDTHLSKGWVRLYTGADWINLFYNLWTKNFMDASHKTYTSENQKQGGKRWALGIVYQIGNDSISGGTVGESALALAGV